MASLTRWTWVWASSNSWWWTGEPGVLQSMGFQGVGHNWATELNWIEGALQTDYVSQCSLMILEKGTTSLKRFQHTEENKHKQNSMYISSKSLQIINSGDIRGTSSIPRSGGSPGEGNDNPLQSSCLGNPMDRRAWQAAAHGVARSWTRLRNWKWLSNWTWLNYWAEIHHYSMVRTIMGRFYCVNCRDCDHSLRSWVSIPSVIHCALVAAAAKSLQSCPTLCDPMEGSPPGSPVPGILQAGTDWSDFPNFWVNESCNLEGLVLNLR